MGRLVLKNHFLPSGGLKMRVVRHRESDDLEDLETLRIHFLTCVLSKMPLGRSR